MPANRNSNQISFSALPPRHSIVRSHKTVLMFGLMLAMAACAGPRQTARRLPPPPETMRGFQVQIFTTENKSSAEEMVTEALNWWASLDEDQKRILYGSTTMPVEVKWLQPYYRVRMGHFRSREEARGLLNRAVGQFPAAFVVPDTIE